MTEKPLPMKTLPERLRMKADLITMGERIAFGSECEIMHEAADYIERMTNARQPRSDMVERVARALYNAGMGEWQREWPHPDFEKCAKAALAALRLSDLSIKESCQLKTAENESQADDTLPYLMLSPAQFHQLTKTRGEVIEMSVGELVSQIIYMCGESSYITLHAQALAALCEGGKSIRVRG